MTSEPVVLEGTLRIVTTMPVPVDAWRMAQAALGTMFFADQFELELELRDAGREHEGDRDHLLSELARCRAEIVRLRHPVD